MVETNRKVDYRELQLILKDDFNLNLDEVQVREFGMSLVEIFDLIYTNEQKFEYRPLRSIDQDNKETI